MELRVSTIDDAYGIDTVFFIHLPRFFPFIPAARLPPN
jgi:hypothetical protein